MLNDGRRRAEMVRKIKRVDCPSCGKKGIAITYMTTGQISKISNCRYCGQFPIFTAGQLAKED